ncbi:MAG: NUDIX hydrolase [Spirochaetes bacterium]|nr:NUDIX hydrolase [Spirochaetota bacterium]
MAMIYKGKIVTLETKKVRWPDGHVSNYECVYHNMAVAIVPVIEKKKILLVRQLRPVVGRKMWELPAGLVDGKEKPVDTARREMEEETGLVPRELFTLGEFYTSPGFTDEKVVLFLATEFDKGEQNFDPGEDIEINYFAIQDTVKKIRKNQIKDSKTIIGLFWALDHLKIKL